MKNKKDILKIVCFGLGTVIGVLLVIFLFNGSRREPYKKIYIDSESLNDIVEIIGLYDDEINGLFINSDYSNDDYKLRIINKRIITQYEPFNVFNNGQFTIYQHRISEKELKKLASKYNIENVDVAFKDIATVCEINPEATTISPEECGEGWTKYYIFAENNSTISTALSPEYEHDFKIYSVENSDIRLDDNVKITWMPTDDTEKHKISYLFGKSSSGYYLKEVKSNE